MVGLKNPLNDGVLLGSPSQVPYMRQVVNEQ